MRIRAEKVENSKGVYIKRNQDSMRFIKTW